jgi:hypothetical protein
MFEISCLDQYGRAVTSLTQWDVNQTLYIENWEHDAPTFHFCNTQSKKSLPVTGELYNGTVTVKIPNILLTQAYPIIVYVYVYDNDNGRTMYVVRIPVKSKPQPEEYEYEENIDGINLAQLDARISTLIETARENNPNGASLEVADARVGFDGVTYGTLGDAMRMQFYDLNEKVTALESRTDFFTVEFDEETRLLHFYDELYGDVYNPVYIAGGGGGGGAGATTSIKVTNENGAAAFAAAAGNPVVLRFTFSSTEDDMPTGNGTCQININGVLCTTVNIVQGLNTVDITKYLKAGTNNVRVKCIDVYGNYKMLVYTISVVDLSITSTFDDSVAFTGEIQFKYTPFGTIQKTIHIIIDGNTNNEISLVTSASGKQFTQILPDLPHGVHTLEVYTDAVLDGLTIESDHLFYDILCVDNGNKTPMIASAYNVSSVSQGTQVSIPFIVYDPSELECDIKLVVFTVDENGREEIYNETPITVNRTKQYWNTRRYPMGDVYFKIVYEYTDIGSGELIQINKTHMINVTESEIDVEAVTNDLEVYLTASGRSNNEANPSQWKYGNITTNFENVNWVSTGWLPDENGDTVLRLNGDAKATINFMPFDSDLRVYGKTIELEFAIRDVNNRNAVVIDCMNENIGFTVTADKATLKSQGAEVSCNYRDEERIRLAFVIESRNEYRLMSVYLNGVLSGVKQYTADDNFQQYSPVNITIGSPYCGVDLYTIRSYSTALTFTEITNNYIYDMSDVVMKYDLYDANDIYDEYGQLSYEDLKKRISVMTIIGDLPQSKGDKKNVRIKYECLFNTAYNFEDNAEIDVQGTSSQWYVRKNYKFECDVPHQHDANQIATKVFCVKADYAEATSTHNTQNANFAHTLYSEKTPAQEIDDRCRSTIYGYPIVIFHQATESSAPEFIGKYNFNFDKGSEEVFGFTTAHDVECWEFKNNTSPACNFLAEVPTKWDEDFEARYAVDENDLSRFRIMHSWVVSTRQDTATGNALTSAYTDIDGVVHTVDNAAYRLAKFKTEFEDYFDMHYSLIYYVYTFVALMVDQRAKNMFLTYWAETGKWQPWLYDNDTCFGINNEGELVFDYYHEDIDIVNNENVYNGQDSTLWKNFRMAFPDEIKATYQNLRNNKFITFDKFIEYFIYNGSDMWSASVYNEDSDYKYISMLKSDNDASNLYQVRGTGEEHLKYFIENRLNYCDSKWYAADYANDYVALRVYTPATWAGIEPNPNITVTPFSNMYAGVRYKANGTLLQQRAEKNVPVTFVPPSGTDLSYDENFSDTESAIYGASQISSLGDLAPLYCGTLNVSKATKLIELKIGDSTEGYVNEHLHSLSIGTNKLLKKINVCNCPKLTSELALAECPNIEEIYATGSGITGVALANSGFLKIVQLPATITSLVLKNQLYIDELTLEGYNSIETLWIENCPTIDELELFNSCPNVKRVRLTGVDWSFEDTSFLYSLKERKLHGIDENNTNTENAWIDGTCHITTLTGEEMAELNRLYPYLKITYTNLTTQLIFMSEDGTTELCRQTIINGGNGVDPITNGTISKPTKTSTAQYTYAFAGWSLTSGGSVATAALNKVTADRYVYASFSSTIRKYTVKFYNGSTLLQTVSNVPYGSTANYTGSTPEKTDVTKPSDYEFVGWNPSNVGISGETNCYAQFKYTGYVYTSLIERILSGEYTNETVETIGTYAMYDQDELESVRFTKATRIEESAFSSCAKLTTVDFYLVNYIGKEAFDYCKQLDKIILRNTEKVCDLYNASAFGRNTPVANGTASIYVPASLIESYKSTSPWNQLDSSMFKSIEDSPEAWEKYEWKTVNYHVEQGDYATYYNVGDSIPLSLSNGNKINMQIVAFDADDLADNSGKAHISFVAEGFTIPIRNKMNPTLIAAQSAIVYYPDNDYPWAAIDGTVNKFQSTNQAKKSSTSYGCWNITPSEDGTLTVNWTVDSEGEKYDYISVYVDGIAKVSKRGGSLQSGTFTVPMLAGTNIQVYTLYTKDSGGDDGTDTATIEFTSDIPITVAAATEVTTVIEAQPAVEGTGTIGGWEKSEMRTHLNNNVLPMIPNDVRSMIKPVFKYSDSYNNSYSKIKNYQTIDSIWIPSVREVYTSGSSYENTGVTYSTFFNSDDARKKYCGSDTSPSSWWTRTAKNTSNFYYVNSSGGVQSQECTSTAGIILGFCV